MDYTTNYNLNLPSGDDSADVEKLNENAEIIDRELFKKVDGEEGKGLSTNDYTTAEKDKLAGIEAGAEVNKPVDQNYMPASENAQSGKAVAEAINPIIKYLSYSISNGEVTITGCDTSISGDYEIPEKIEGYTVTEIGANAFINCASLKSIALPRYVGRIRNNAFKNCSTLETVTHSYIDGETQIIIGIDAFSNCSSLSDVYIVYEPDSDTITKRIGSGNGYYTAATFHYNQAPAKLEDVYNHHDSTKQDKLTAGENITIENGVISASGGSAEDNFELVETITLTAETTASMITRNIDTQGNPYSFKDIFVSFKFPSAVSTSTRISLGIYLQRQVPDMSAGSTVSGGKIFVTQTYVQNAMVAAHTERKNGVLKMYMSKQGTATQNADTTPTIQNSFYLLAGDVPITSIYLQFGTDPAPVNFPVGTIINIYGVK